MLHFTTSVLTRSCRVGLLAALIGSLGLGLAGCKKDGSEPAAAAPAPNVKLSTSAALGSFLTDSVGNAVYFFALDADGTNSCTSAACNPTWPVYYGGKITAPAGMKTSDFSSKKTADGRSQTLYKGWPLYYFAPAASGVNTREAAGQTTGNGIGSVWHVVNPSYGVVLARKAVEDQTTHVVTTKTYLADDQGRTLYYYAKDNANPNTLPTNCTGGCAGAWPALALGMAIVPSSLRPADFAAIERDVTTTTTGGGYGTAGTTTTTSNKQLTYKGHPLYYFAGDNMTRGRITGDHLTSFGDFWFVAAP